MAWDGDTGGETKSSTGFPNLQEHAFKNSNGKKNTRPYPNVLKAMLLKLRKLEVFGACA